MFILQSEELYELYGATASPRDGINGVLLLSKDGRVFGTQKFVPEIAD